MSSSLSNSSSFSNLPFQLSPINQITYRMNVINLERPLEIEENQRAIFHEGIYHACFYDFTDE